MFTPARLKLARQRRQLTAAALARALDVGPRSVSDFEHGRRTPTGAELAELARVLGFPVEFFAAGEPAELAEDVVSFRARAKLPARRRTGALAAGRLAIEFNAFLERRFTLPEVDVPVVDSTPSAAVDAVREQWQLGSKPAPNLVHLLEAHGVRVFSLGVDHTDVDAFSFWHDGTPYVFLNTAKSAEHGRFDAAHELGHLVLHAGGRPLNGVDVEAEADAFASAMLMPDVDVLTYVPDDPTKDQVLRACPRWRVSPLALTRRLRELRQVGDDVYRALGADLAKLDSDSDQARESSQLLAKVFKALREQGMSPHELAAELMLSTQELNNIVFGLVVTALPGRSSALRTPGGRTAHLRLV
ncbi:helix-turn-helix domain-containing protein [Kutzneria chonburiensis]|uniref:XRE family transcriptional regulator n=1 Tax=Kutzneria chonburiensis TaxID=1483604 RepID=A0ABV6N064_9PSEU|nr:XRE family transcriptional regulator [Kutzneria chonburiensis]